MKGGKGRLFYMGIRDVTYMLIYAIILLGLTFGLRTITDTEFSVSIDCWTMMGFFFVSESMSYRKYNQYITFGFCRKKFYLEQCILTPVRAAVAAIERTLVQMLFYEEYVSALTDGNVMEMVTYHPISVAELFLTNLLIFSLVNFAFLIINSKYKRSWLSKENGKTPRQKEILEKKKKSNNKHTSVLGYVGEYMLAVFLGVLMPAYSQFQLQTQIAERMVIVIVLLILCVVSMVMGARRYKPEYI